MTQVVAVEDLTISGRAAAGQASLVPEPKDEQEQEPEPLAQPLRTAERARSLSVRTRQAAQQEQIAAPRRNVHPE